MSHRPNLRPSITEPMKIQAAPPRVPAGVRAWMICATPSTTNASGQNWRNCLARRMSRLSSVNITPIVARSRPKTSWGVIRIPGWGAIELLQFMRWTRSMRHDLVPDDADADRHEEEGPRVPEPQHAHFVQQQPDPEEHPPAPVRRSMLRPVGQFDQTDTDQHERPEGRAAEGIDYSR